MAPPAILIAAANPAAVPTRSDRTDIAPLFAAGMVSPLPMPMNTHGPKNARMCVTPSIARTRPTSNPIHVIRRAETRTVRSDLCDANRPQDSCPV